MEHFPLREKSNAQMSAFIDVGGVTKPTLYKWQPSVEFKKKTKSLQGPKRAIRLFLLGIILPGLFISVPLYLKHRVYDYQVYPIGMSDMRLIDNRVSTTWCQRQLVKSNATFNAFLMPELPRVAKERTSVSMTRHLSLSDDMKEYWGFYLLKGSKVTVSSCARWPGSSLILIRGHRHLHECAYIGDNSSEELEELMEIYAEGGKIQIPEVSEESPSNRVELLTKHRPGVQFHDPTKLKGDPKNYMFKNKESETEEVINTKQMKELLAMLSFKADKAQTAKDKISAQEKEERYLKLKHELLNHQHKKRIPTLGKFEDDEFIKFDDMLENENTTNHIKNASSKELMEGVLRKLKTLGTKGERVLELLKNVDQLKNKSATLDEEVTNLIENISEGSINSSTSDSESDIKESDETKENISETVVKNSNEKELLKNNESSSSKSPNNNSNETEHEKLLREKRELILKTVLSKELNNDEEENENLAIEEGYKPDGIADHHEQLNQTNLNDRSNSEFWSSFSSSEEALLNCAGLILSLPLTPHRSCESERGDSDFEAASLANKVTYIVPTNGYYFFVFNSENEVQQNYLRVHFDLEKTMYNVSNPVSMCNNASSECDFNLKFFSNQKVVFELPANVNETRWNEEFVVVSECEPRTAIYLLCVLAVPLLILFFAFQ